MALPATDNFNRADADPPGGNWTVPTGGHSCNITANTLRGDFDFEMAAVYWNADVFNNDQESSCLIPNTAHRLLGPIVRAQTTGYQYYYCEVDTSTMQLYKITGANTRTALGSSVSITRGVSDIYKIRAVGSTISMYQNGIQVGTNQTDTTFASGAAGIGFYKTAQAADDWTGDNVVTEPYPAGYNKSLPRVIINP